MPQEAEASGYVPHLRIDAAAVPVLPDGAHDGQGLVDGAEDLHGAHAVDEGGEERLLLGRGEAAGDGEGPDEGAQGQRGRQGAQQVDGGGDAGADLGQRGLQAGRDDVQVGQGGLGPDARVQGHGGRLVRLVVGDHLVEARVRRHGVVRRGVVDVVRFCGLCVVAGAGDGGRRGLERGEPRPQARVDGAGALDELDHREGAGGLLRALPRGQGGDVGDGEHGPAVAADVLAEADARGGAGEQLGVVLAQAGGLAVGRGGDDVDPEQVGRVELVGGLVGREDLAAVLQGDAAEGDADAVHDGRPGRRRHAVAVRRRRVLRDELVEEGDGGVVVRGPVRGVGHGDLELEQLGDALDAGDALAEGVRDAAGVEGAHVGAQGLDGGLLVRLQLGPVGALAGAVRAVRAVEEHGVQPVGERERRVEERAVLHQQHEHPAAARLEEAGPVEGEEEGHDVVEVDHRVVHLDLGLVLRERVHGGTDLCLGLRLGLRLGLSFAGCRRCPWRCVAGFFLGWWCVAWYCARDTPIASSVTKC